MSRSRTAFLSGTITDNPLTNVATTINSAALASLPAIASPDIAVLVLDPTGSAGAPEVVYVTAHTGSATSATISRGQEGSSARQHASGIAWVHGPTLYDFKGWRLEGSSVTEGTSTSTSDADLVTISGLLIPVTAAVRITYSGRKTSGAAADALLGLKINSTVVVSTTHVGLMLLSNAANEAMYGQGVITIGPRETNYLNNISGQWSVRGSTGYTGTVYDVLTNPIPNATITSITIIGKVSSASITVAAKNVYVEMLDL